MEPAQQLYDLQALDLRIAANGTKLETERAKIKEPASIRQARAAIQSAEQRLAGLQKELRATEQEVATVSARKAAVHAQLYGGKVAVPRELTALEAEENAMARSISQLEDRELELMGAAEDAEKVLAAAQQALEQALATWQDEGAEAHQHINQIEAEVEDLRAQRVELAGQVSPAHLATYERMRPRHGNRPIAIVQNNMCQACRVNLPSSDVQRARGADPPSTCENCGRLLFVR